MFSITSFQISNRSATLTKGIDFALDCVHLVYKKCYKMKLNQSGTYIDSFDYINNKQATINPINRD